MSFTARSLLHSMQTDACKLMQTHTTTCRRKWTHASTNRCTQAQTDAHKHTQTHRRTRTNREQTQTNTMQTAFSAWVDTTSRHVQTLDIFFRILLTVREVTLAASLQLLLEGCNMLAFRSALLALLPGTGNLSQSFFDTISMGS